MLRAQTHDAHERLHEHRSFAALFRGDLTRRDYGDLMRFLHGFYAPLDEEIVRVMAEIPTYSGAYTYARRSGLLARDLRDLEFSRQGAAQDRQYGQVADIVSSRSLGGVLYVIEGAMLGGATIDRAVQKLLPDNGVAGRRYWAWCRSENRHRWGMTLEYLEHLSAGQASLDDLVAGAQATFQALADWLAPLDAPELALEGGSA